MDCLNKCIMKGSFKTVVDFQKLREDDDEEEMDLDDESPLQALGLHRVGQLPPRPAVSHVPGIPLNKRGTVSLLFVLMLSFSLCYGVLATLIINQVK